jgi:DNA polymerase-4
VIGSGEAQAFLATRPTAILPGVGPAMVKSLASAGFSTVGDIAQAEPRDMARRFGAHGTRLWDLAHGRDGRPVDPDSARKGISAETTFNDDLISLADLEDRLAPLCERVARQARASGVVGRVAMLKLKADDFRIITRRRVLATPTQTARTLFTVARELLAPEVGARRWRLIGVGLGELLDSNDAEHDLFGDGERRALAGERSVDAIRARFGPDVVTSGRALKARKGKLDGEP